MKAFMSKNLKKIISSPQGAQELRRAILCLSSKQQTDAKETIHINNKKYTIQFVKRKNDPAEG